MAKKKKPQPQKQAPLSPKKYLLNGIARKLPVYECWINPDWEESGLATVIIARKHPNGNITFATYLTDVFCLGLKDTMYFYNESENRYEEMCELIYENAGQEREEVEYVFAHNLVYGSIEYAEELGFKPNKDWSLTQFVLNEDDDKVEMMEIEFGREGMPVYISGPFDNPNRIINTLRKSVGEGNFDIIFTDGDTYQNRLLQGDNSFSLDELIPEGETGFNKRVFHVDQDEDEDDEEGMSEEEMGEILNVMQSIFGTEGMIKMVAEVAGINEKELIEKIKQAEYTDFEETDEEDTKPEKP
jgi:hypothetical protein